LLLVGAVTSHAAVYTSVKTFGNNNGSERCLVGNESGLCTDKGAYKGKFSITHLFETGEHRSLERVADADAAHPLGTDQIWTSPLGYIEVRGFAHYLSGHGTSVAGFGTTKADFHAFPGAAEIQTVFGRDNIVLGPQLDNIGDHVQGGSFLNVNVGTDPFYFLYRSAGKTYSSNNFLANGFDNVSGGLGDHMVTWNAGTTVDLRGNRAILYLIAFERAHIDDDFQDGVYEVRVPVQVPVPEPSPYVVLVAGLGLVGWRALQLRKAN
jgi:hypothetical protein